MLRALARIHAEELGRHYKTAARRSFESGKLHAGAVTFVQRFGSSLNLHVHLHTCALDGVYVDDEDADAPRFVPAAAPSRAELTLLTERVALRVMTWLRKRGYAKDEDDHPSNDTPDRTFAEALAQVATQRGTVENLKDDSGESEGPAEPDAPPVDEAVTRHRFNLHARRLPDSVAPACPRPSPHGGESEPRIATRERPPPRDTTGPIIPAGSPVSATALARNVDGADIPLPNVLSAKHLARIAGGLLHAATSSVPWATLLARTFEIDVNVCARCAGRLEVRAVVTDLDVARRILDALPRAARAPPHLDSTLCYEPLFADTTARRGLRPPFVRRLPRFHRRSELGDHVVRIVPEPNIVGHDSARNARSSILRVDTSEEACRDQIIGHALEVLGEELRERFRRQRFDEPLLGKDARKPSRRRGDLHGRSSETADATRSPTVTTSPSRASGSGVSRTSSTWPRARMVAIVPIFR